MKIKVKLFAVFRDIVGAKAVVLAVEPGTTVQMLLDQYIARFPQMAKFREHKLVTVKGKTVTILSPAKLTALLRKHLGE